MKKLILIILLLSCNKIIKNIEFRNKDINEDLIQAIINNDKNRILELINRGADINYKDNSGYTPLIIASKNGYIDIVKLLLEKDANINDKGKDGWTALMLVSSNGYMELVKLMIEKETNIKSSQFNDCTALVLALEKGYIEVAKLLIEKSANINDKEYNGHTALIIALKKGYIGIAKLLIEKGVNINERNKHEEPALEKRYMGFNINKRNKHEEPLLMLALEKGYIEIVKLMIEKETNIKSSQFNDCTALVLALEKGYIEVVELLIEKGADIGAGNKFEKSALTLALEKGYIGIVKLMIEKGTNINKGSYNDYEGYDALKLALKKGYIEVAKLLIEKDVDINKRREHEEPLLMLALEKGYIEIVKLMIEKGTNINEGSYNDYKGYDALRLALKKGYIEVAKLLIEKDVDINKRRKYEEPLLILMLALDKGYIEIVRLLLERDVDINLKSYDSYYSCRALMLALKKGYIEVAKLLIEKGANINGREGYFNYNSYNVYNALMLASQEGNIEIIKLLLEKGANINDKASNGYTALMLAAEEGHKKVVNLLIERGANINERVNATWISRGKSALTIAYENNYGEIIELLVSKGADIVGLKNINLETILVNNIKNRKVDNCLGMIESYGNKINYKYKDKDSNNNLLHYVALIEDIILFEELLNRGCDINWKNNLKETPLSIALSKINVNELFALYLIRKGAILNPNVKIHEKPLKEFLCYYDGLYNKLILKPLIKKFFYDLNLLEKDKNELKKVLKVLNLEEEDFNNKDKKLMIDFIKDTIKFKNNAQLLNVCEIGILSIMDNNIDVDFNIDVFVSILSNFTIDDFEVGIQNNGIDYIKRRFIKRIEEIKDAVPINKLNKPIKPNNSSNDEMINYENCMKEYNLKCIKFFTKRQLYKLGLLITRAADSERDKQTIRLAMNIILENLVCHVGTLEAIDQAIKCLINQDNNNDLRDVLSKEIMEFRIRLIKEVAQNNLHNKITCISELGREMAEYSNHMLAYLVMDLSNELKVTGLHENEFKYEYNKEFVIKEVKKLYKERFINEMVELIKDDARLSNMIRDHLEKSIFKTNSYLMIEDFIHDDGYRIKDNIIKILLKYFGYLK